MKKTIIFTMLMMLILFLAACGNETEKTNAKEKSQTIQKRP